MTTKIKRTRSEARIAYWASIPKEQRSQHARNAAKAKAKKMTQKQKSDHGKMMIAARRNKK